MLVCWSQGMFSDRPSLLDLPELALGDISKHLDLRSLANAMQTCSRMNSLLRPQQTGMV